MSYIRCLAMTAFVRRTFRPSGVSGSSRFLRVVESAVRSGWRRAAVHVNGRFTRFRPLPAATRRPSGRYTIVRRRPPHGVYRRFRQPEPARALRRSRCSRCRAGRAWAAMERARRDRASCRRMRRRSRSRTRSFRAATGELTAQIAVAAGGARRTSEQGSALDPARARDGAPAGHRQVARGGRPAPAVTTRSVFVPGFNAPEDTFGVLRDLLFRVESRLRTVQAGVERRQALAARRRPSGRRTAGSRTGSAAGADPFTGEPDSTRASTSPPTRAAGLRDGRRHRRVGRRRAATTATWSSSSTASASTTRYGAPATASRVTAGQRGAARRRRSATSAPPAARPARTCTTKFSPTAS